MTSKRCFSKIMKEDFRHKVWMLVLSILGNIMTLPVAFLISLSNRRYSDGVLENLDNLTYRVYEIERFFTSYCVILGGIIAVAGALIVGLFGFRYVFHRNMTDTWHSMPVKRRTLFAAGWLNGFLIWFVPFAVCLTVTLAIGESRLSGIRKSVEALTLDAAGRQKVATWSTAGGLILNALLSALVLTIAFLLVYHLVLFAVMVCGNVLNTLVTTAVLGLGAVSVYGLLAALCSIYLDTYIGRMAHFEEVLYASPLASAVGVLAVRMESQGGFGQPIVLNLLIAAALGALALVAYGKRPSELSEQGISNRPIRFLTQIATSAAAVLGGWIIFYSITFSVAGRKTALSWGIFGGLVAGILVFGVMDIIFHMDFKAFFSHKALMAAVMASGLLTCLAFYFDWFGYDGYVPEESDIAEIAIYDFRRSNMRGYYLLDFEDEEHPLNQVRITDGEAAHAFLEAAADFAENGFPEGNEVYYSEAVSAKITLKSGRVYYRGYEISSHNSEAAYELLTSPEYLDAAFRISDEEKAAAAELYIGRGSAAYNLSMETEERRREIIDKICDAYNKDLEEHPDVFIRQDGRRLAEMKLYSSVSYQTRRLEVYEEMSNTREALRQCGFEDCAEPMEAEDVQELRLSLQCMYRDIEPGESLVELARQLYGVASQEQASEDGTAVCRTEDAEIVRYDSEEEIELCITDPEEIRELLELISYGSPAEWDGMFRPAPVDSITILDRNNWESRAWIPAGTLPEKYILRFGELEVQAE